MFNTQSINELHSVKHHSMIYHILNLHFGAIGNITTSTDKNKHVQWNVIVLLSIISLLFWIVFYWTAYLINLKLAALQSKAKSNESLP